MPPHARLETFARPVLNLNICSKTSTARLVDSARKKTRAKMTANIIHDQPIATCHHLSYFGLPKTHHLMRVRTSSTPWMPPQSMNFQSAPCHRPPQVITSMVLRSVWYLLPWFPPKG